MRIKLIYFKPYVHRYISCFNKFRKRSTSNLILDTLEFKESSIYWINKRNNNDYSSFVSLVEYKLYYICG